MTRRELLASWLLPAGMACVDEMARAQTRRRRAAPHSARGPGKLDRVGVSSLSFHNSFPATRDAAAPASTGKLALLDFPEMVADRYKVHNLEFTALHLASVEPAYLLELKSSVLRAHSRVINIAADIRELESGAGLSDPSAGAREAAIAGAKKWIDVARQLGARSVSCDPGAVDPGNLQITFDSFRRLAAYGRGKSIVVLIENRAGADSSIPDSPASIGRGVGGPFIGALPDFGNFTDEAARTRVLPTLFAYAHTLCHATGLKLDAAGSETAFNFQRCVQIAQKAGFRGIYSVDYEGDGNPYDGVQKVVNELLLYL